MVASPQPTRENYTPSERVVRVVADETGVDPLDLPPLYDTIDTDALNAAVDGLESGSVRFDYAGLSVTVGGDGSVTTSEESHAAFGRQEPTAND